MSTDTISEVLRAVRLKGAVFFAVDARGAWVAEAPAARELGPHIMPGVEYVIEYHVVTAGSCWGGIVDEPPVRLGPGDIIVFPQGDSHVMSSAPGMRGVPNHDNFQRALTNGLPLAMTMDAGEGDRAEVICGFFGCDARPFNPLLSNLPRVIHLPGGESKDGVIEQFAQMALSESARKRPGGDAVLARLSELLFVEVVRRYLAMIPPENVGWLAGLRDDAIGGALAKLHDRPAHPWTLELLAREIGLSRSVLAERFAHFVGIPPMQYLARWRMQVAASLLSSTALNLAEIAARVGYGSETAFSHAYKRWVGVAPADWRKGKRSETAAQPAV
jgi:AraC-like DNA-binding protein